jgi:hypothetical protein
MERHYLAGFFDGEGCVGLYYAKGSKVWVPSISISQNTSVQVSKLFVKWAQVFGGFVSTRDQGRVLQFSFRKSACVAAFVQTIGPLCVGKRHQLIVLGHWLSTKEYSYRTAQTLKALKRSEQV